MAELFQIPYIETSAMSGFNVDLLFRKVAKDVFVEALDRLRENGEPGISEEDRGNKRILKLTSEPRRFVPKTGNICKCS